MHSQGEIIWKRIEKLGQYHDHGIDLVFQFVFISAPCIIEPPVATKLVLYGKWVAHVPVQSQ